MTAAVTGAVRSCSALAWPILRHASILFPLPSHSGLTFRSVLHFKTPVPRPQAWVAQVRLWTGRQRRSLPMEVCTTTTSHATGNWWQLALPACFFDKGLLFSWRAHELITCIFFSFFKLIRVVWIVYAMCLKINIHSKFLSGVLQVTFHSLGKSQFLLVKTISIF